MKVGVITAPLYHMTLGQTLEYLQTIGVDAVELGTGGFPGYAHCNPQELLGNAAKLCEFKRLFEQSSIEISALSCHGNAVHPNESVASKSHETFVHTIQLAQELGVKKVITFSGCPGDSPTSNYPNWVTCPWPDDFMKVLDYQWNDCLLPYWHKAAALAKSAGVKVALEMHPGFCVYNTASMRRLRSEVGNVVGANFDPSHLIWQGMNIVAAIRDLGDAIYHFHAKDCKVDIQNTMRKGVLDTLHYGDELNRSWIFRTMGYGHGEDFWRDVISALRMIGYDDAICIEHEDSLMSPCEGLEKAVMFVRNIIIKEQSAGMWWA